MTLGLAFFLITLAFVAIGLFIFWVEPLSVLPFLERVTPNILYRVRTELPLIALSFDDGPHPVFTPHVLDILWRYNAKATFFLIGEHALRHPDLLAAVRAAGHEVGNHYFKNGSTLTDSDAAFLGNLDQTATALGTAGSVPFEGQAPPAQGGLGPEGLSCSDEGLSNRSLPHRHPALFRPPGGIAWPGQIQLARERGYTGVLGCAYPHDPMHPPVWYIRWLVEKNLVPGAIVILHDGISDATRTLQALPHILEAAHKKGLRVVSIGELMCAARSSS